MKCQLRLSSTSSTAPLISPLLTLEILVLLCILKTRRWLVFLLGALNGLMLFRLSILWTFLRILRGWRGRLMFVLGSFLILAYFCCSMGVDRWSSRSKYCKLWFYLFSYWFLGWNTTVEDYSLPMSHGICSLLSFATSSFPLLFFISLYSTISTHTKASYLSLRFLSAPLSKHPEKQRIVY